MSWIKIVEGKAVVSSEGMSLPLVQKVYKVDKSNKKSSFEIWMRYLYLAYFKGSIYWNYLPEEREKQVIQTVFTDKSLTYFKKIAGMSQLIEFVIDSTYTFKEKLYRRLLQDIEESMDRLSKIPLTKTVRVKGERAISFRSQKTGEQVTEMVPLDVRVVIDNSEEKVKSMDLLDKLLKREKILHDAVEKERISGELKIASGRRKYDL